MKTRYFVKENFCFRPKLSGMELIFDGESYAYKDDNAGVAEYAFTSKGGDWEKYVVKVEEMELSDFIADGRTKYELNGIRFVVDSVNEYKKTIEVKTDNPCCITKLHGYDSYFNIVNNPSVCDFIVLSRHHESANHYHSHIEDIKLVTTCGQCGKYEVMDNGKCCHCTMESELMDKKMCEHDEIVYTSSQYIEAIEKEVPDLKDVRNKYDVQIVGKDGVKTTVDVYRVLNAFDVHDAATQHAIKKLLAAGKRGHKDYVQDLKEAIASIELAIIEWEQTNV